ncbi:hypothetical protein C8Q80DRAFT_1193345 [Daedaleopsis nitida]|nr:hypothetical protein C8Q80DRAFT_1193345 [Daedaleopsis nitida]
MSFNARLGSSNVHRRRPHRPYHKPLVTQEDVQPNESLRKDHSGRPPTIRSSGPLPRKIRRSVSNQGNPLHSPVTPSFLAAKQGHQLGAERQKPQQRIDEDGPRHAVQEPVSIVQEGNRATASSTVTQDQGSSPSVRQHGSKHRSKGCAAASHLGAIPMTHSFRGVIWKDGSANQVNPLPHDHSHSRCRPLPTATSSSLSLPSASSILLNDLGHSSMPPKSGTLAGVTRPVKRERSPSPLLDTLPHPVTEGCIRIAPLPAQCHKSRPNFKVARQKLSMVEVKKLRELGLQPTRVFTRDDGMVIDWKSDIPVMSDTLLPVSQSVSIALQPTQARKKHKAPTGTLDVDRDGPRSNDRVHPGSPGDTLTSFNSPSLLDPNSRSRSSTDGAQQQQPDDEPSVVEITDTQVADGSSTHPYAIDIDEDSSKTSNDPDAQPMLSTLLNGGTAPEDETESAVIAHPVSGSTLHTPSTQAAVRVASPSRAPPSRALNDGGAISARSNELDMDLVEAEAVNFLRQYLLTFYEDRAVLARAYSRVATLSIQGPPKPAASPNCADQPTPYQGRTNIVAALLALPEEQPLYHEDGEGMGEVDWDVVGLNDTGDTLLVCYATDARAAGGGSSAKGKGRAETWVYEQRFLLRRKDWDEEDR